MEYKKQLAGSLASQLEGMDESQIMELLEYPPNPDMGDLSMPCFKLSKVLRKAPQAIAEELKAKLDGIAYVERVEAVSGYLNIYLDKAQFVSTLLQDVLTRREAYGSSTMGEGKTIVLDFSSPNIAKPFHVGHLRTTIIGNALYKLFDFLGYDTVRVNHLGDWGTQFGKLIVAYQKWGSKEQVEAEGISELLRLYVKFHDEADHAPELEDEARAWFVKLEQGDSEAGKLWKWFVDISLKEFSRIYKLLGVEFDSYAGESFYNDKMGPVIEELKEKNLLEEDEGAMLVRLDEYNMAPALILKKDGSSLYHTRDITAALYRKKTYDFDKCIYVVDAGQSLHFQQWFKVIELMGYDWADKLVHVPFGKVSLEGAKLSTRKGNVVMLEDLLTQSISKIREIIDAKNPDMPNKDEVARQVGVGAIIFNDLSTNRIKDIVFSWEEALNFDGETGPYVQYTHARCCSLLRKANGSESTELPAGGESFDASLLLNDSAYQAAKEAALFPEKVVQAMNKLEPSLISRYLVDLAQSFNRFYHECPILVDDAETRKARLALVKTVQLTLQNGLRLIGLESPKQI
ncbi:arginine--tRNA ligase [Paenibacillus sp. J31TS4]|uniref:arginine--tRNA ligase n=1 Tax=Paenibacillus sp. J31TS4 TaxID=2807195 RepID=UPI001BCC8687|nr:arginine--tRNA ligase [Paenibacillus sp. J31TS4]